MGGGRPAEGAEEAGADRGGGLESSGTDLVRGAPQQASMVPAAGQARPGPGPGPAKRGQVGLVRHSEEDPSAGGKGRVIVRCRWGGRETRAAAVRWEGCTRVLTRGPAGGGGGDAVRKGGARDGEVRARGGSRRWGRAHAGRIGRCWLSNA